MPRFIFKVEVEVEKTSGKFVGKDELQSEIQEALEGADYGSWSVDESEYETATWDVSAE